MRSTPRSRATRSLFAVILLFASTTGAPAQEEAGGEPARNGLAREAEFRIPPQALASAVVKFSEQAAVQLVSQSDDLADLTTRGVSGRRRIEDALQRLLKGTPIEWEVVNGGTIVLRRTAEPLANPSPSAPELRTGTIRGTVTLPEGDAAVGVTVAVASLRLPEAAGVSAGSDKGTRTTQTDRDGNYALTDLSPGRYTLDFELAGFAPTRRAATVNAEEEATIDVVLELEEFEEDVVVVGSRLGTTPVESALPIKVLDREQIDRSGASTVAQALSLLPEVSINNNGDGTFSSFSRGVEGTTNSTTVQLRGLPLGTTLVLVNGRRIGTSAAQAGSGSRGFFDLSNIPLSLVERIEVLPYGASAVYGGDGLAGVINIVTKRNAQGLDVQLRTGMASGYEETQASVTWGQAWSRGSLTTTTSYVRSGTLSSSERALTRDHDYRRFGGRDLRSASAANPGTVYSLDGCPPAPSFCTLPLDQRGNLPGLDAPVAGIPAGQDGEGLTVADFAATAGAPNLGSRESRFFAESETASLAIRGRYEFSPQLELFGDLLYSRREVPPFERRVLLTGGELGLVRVSADNPFNPFGVEVGVDVSQRDTGIFDDFRPEYLEPTLGVRGGWGEWTWELVSSLSKDLTDALSFSQDRDALQAALASPDRATALNVFRGDDGSFGSQELLDSLFTPLPRDLGSDLWQANAFVRGPLAELPAGRLEALLGVEWMRQELNLLQSPEDSESTDNVSGSDESHAIFGEVRLPLVRRVRGQRAQASELLTLTGAFRVDDSDRFEETGTTETVGLELRPVSTLLLRASTSSAFKPLSPFSAFQSPNPLLASIRDPQKGGEVFLVELEIGGGVPAGLKPETSTTSSVGLVWSPTLTADLNLSVTAWRSRLRDRLAVLSAQELVDNESSFPGRVIRDPQAGVIIKVDRRILNITSTDTEGVDLGLSWRWSTRHGTFLPSLAATWVGQHEERLTPASPIVDNLSVYNGLSSSSWSPRWKGAASLVWEYRDDVGVALTGRYVSAYQDGRPLDTGPTAGTFQNLGDFWLLDLNIDLSIGSWLATQSTYLSSVRLSLGAVNLLDKSLDFCNVCGVRGYDSSQYDVRGRSAHVDFMFSF